MKPLALAAVALLALTGCASTTPADPAPSETTATAQTPTPTPEPTEEPGAQSIEDVWEVVDCSENDRESLGMISEASAPVLRQASCRPFGGDGDAYFFELASPGDVNPWLRSGGLEVGSGEAVYVDGAVVILATDAATAQRLGQDFEPAP